jgi:hypothetical protein
MPPVKQLLIIAVVAIIANAVAKRLPVVKDYV